jgi:hypothetical protein
MKIRVNINGILEAEMELPEMKTGDSSVRDWDTWHSNQYIQAMRFIDKCATQATAMERARPRELDTTTP